MFFKLLKDALKIKQVRSKILFTIFIVLVFVNVVADILGGYNSYLSMSINTAGPLLANGW